MLPQKPRSPDDRREKHRESGFPRWALAGLLLLALLGLGAATSKPTTKPRKAKFAQLLLHNGNIITMDKQRPRAQAVAISQGRILAVGSSSRLRRWIGPNTRRIDLKGKTVIPGLIEGHGHLLGLGLSRVRLRLDGTTSIAQITQKVRQEAKKLAPGEWILGRGWDQNDWKTKHFPTHHPLNKAAPKHPVFLRRIDGHAAWLNRLAMERAGIHKGTPDPPGGKLLRDAKGNPTGVLIDNAMGLVRKHIPSPSRAQQKRALLLAIKTCLSHGLTGFHDAGVGASTLSLYKELLREGKLNLRLYVMLSAGDKALRQRYLQRGPEIGLGNDFLTIRSFKLMADGALGSRGAALLKPYADNPKHRGLLILSEQEIFSFAQKALQRGFQINTHAIGDRANHTVLNAYARAFKTHPQHKDHRFRIEHAQILHGPDIPRFAKLGVIASMQPTHCTSDMPWVHARIGKQRAQSGAYVWQSLLQSGAKIVAGSDVPVESANPFWGLYAAITRQDHKQQPPGGWYPGQRLTRMQALRAYTLDAAFAAFEEQHKGSITPGKWADLVVLDRDIMKVPPPSLRNTRTLLTLIAGNIQYQSSSLTLSP